MILLARIRIAGEHVFRDQRDRRVGLGIDDRPALRIEPQERLAIVGDALLIRAREATAAGRRCCSIIRAVVNTAVIWYGTMSPTQPMMCACPDAASGFAIEAMAIVASTWSLRDRGDHVGDLLHRPQRHARDVEVLGLGDAAQHVVERRAVLRDGEAVAGEFRGRGQAGGVGLLRHQDGGALIAALLVQPAADDLQRALLGQVEEAAGQRGDADIDIAGHGGRGDRLCGLEEAERQRRCLRRGNSRAPARCRTARATAYAAVLGAADRPPAPVAPSAAAAERPIKPRVWSMCIGLPQLGIP